MGLVNQKAKNTYKDFVYLDNSNLGATETPVRLKDGKGAELPVQISTNEFNFDAGTLKIDGEVVGTGGGGGGGSTNLTTTLSPTTITIVSSSGTDATIPLADATNAGVLSPAEKTKLAGIQTGATTNSTDSQLRDRATHTGEQNISTVTGLQTALDGKQATGDYATNTALEDGLETKENTITAGTTAQYYRGDKTFQTLDKTAIGLENVDNTSDLNKPVSSATRRQMELLNYF